MTAAVNMYTQIITVNTLCEGYLLSSAAIITVAYAADMTAWMNMMESTGLVSSHPHPGRRQCRQEDRPFVGDCETDVNEMRGRVSEAVSDSIEVRLCYKNATDAWTDWFTRLGYITM